MRRKHGKLIRNAHMISNRRDLCIKVYKHNICDFEAWNARGFIERE